MTLEFIGWGLWNNDEKFRHHLVDGPSGKSLNVTGYNAGDYWDGANFLGPDVYGIVPVYSDENGKQFPPEATVYPHIA